MTEGNQRLTLKNANETRNYFIKEINKNKLMRNKHKKACRILNYTEHLLTLAFTFTECFSMLLLFL